MLAAVAAALPLLAIGAEAPLWLRHSAISPDGSTVLFTYKGDIYSVPSAGGRARQLTTHTGHDSHPVWSPDGKRIAFSSTRMGGADVYVMPADGGEPRRITVDSGTETPLAWDGGGNVLFSASDMPSAESIIFPSASFSQVYKVSADGGRPVLFSATTMEDPALGADGRILYHDNKGYEDPFRKHHRSPITRDVWMVEDGRHTKLTSFDGEDRTPVWAPGGQSFYYLSEESGSFNVHRRSIWEGESVKITDFTEHPVRYLTSSADGLLCFSYDGELYTMREGSKPVKISVEIVADKADRDLVRQTLTSGATEIALSPSGKEIAFVARGDVYVTSLDYKTTKQITDTPGEERNIGFAPDGRTLAYASERAGVWSVYTASIADKDEKNFTYCTDVEEELVVGNGKSCQQPSFSPDGKKIAYFEDRCSLMVADVKSKKTTMALDGKYLYSYQDGDLWFEWSPDGKWLLAPYFGNGGWNNADIAAVAADGSGEIHNITQSGYVEGGGKWVLGGKAVMYASDRNGYRSHGSWGAEYDYMVTFLDLDAYEQFRMNKEDRALWEDSKGKEKKGDEDAKKEDKDKKEEKPKAAKPIDMDWENAKHRTMRLTVNSSRLGDAVLTPEGDVLYYLSAFEGGLDLWKHELREGRTQIVMKSVGGGALVADKDCKNLYMCSGGGIKKMALPGGAVSNIAFEADFKHRPYVERRCMTDHVYQQVKDKFYLKDLHGTPWDSLHKAYSRFLPHINNNYDYSEMLSELLGELNASHTGARYRAPGAAMQTACLGVFYDESYDGDGLKIKEILKRGPFAVKDSKVTPGCVIVEIDGQPVLKGEEYRQMLDGKAGKSVRLTINPPKGKDFDVTIKPISKGAQQELLYLRWVERNRRFVDSISGGKIAYVHVKAMDSPSFRTVYSELLSDENRQKVAAIVDERHNGGGWLHDDLCTLLGGKRYQDFVVQGKYIGSDPFNKWTKPSCVMVCEDDYSNGHGFPTVYQHLGLGKLVGTPVAGTMTAVWWETMQDRSLVFGIPQVGVRDVDGNYGENKQLNPDILVYNTPEDMLSGNDRQLKKAVEHLLKGN